MEAINEELLAVCERLLDRLDGEDPASCCDSMISAQEAREAWAMHHANDVDALLIAIAHAHEMEARNGS